MKWRGRLCPRTLQDICAASDLIGASTNRVAGSLIQARRSQMTKRTMMLIGLAASGMYAVSVHAQPPMGPHHMGCGGPGRLIHVILHSADLTADQETQAHSILDSNRSAAEGLFTQLHQANTDLATLLLGPQDVQADALSNQLTKINQLQLQLAQQEATTVSAIRALLKPEQLAKAAAAESEMQADMADHPHFRHQIQ
jgi:Spy/CpxP family protein refolding chaperone